MTESEANAILFSWKRTLAAMACAVCGALMGAMLTRLVLHHFYDECIVVFEFKLTTLSYLHAIWFPACYGLANRFGVWLRQRDAVIRQHYIREKFPIMAGGGAFLGMLWGTYQLIYQVTPNFYNFISMVIIITPIGVGVAYFLTRLMDDKVWFKATPTPSPTPDREGQADASLQGGQP